MTRITSTTIHTSVRELYGIHSQLHKACKSNFTIRKSELKKANKVDELLYSKA